ncbi:MAG TPA: DUF4118 domain-containing protein [Rhodocyclaceae bacterium]|nr:DUF4118 domain-containing protein [Rhodocyclaceae bacterium]HRQ46017.1 DUF4118 domain-containing protein [Rhodocyclaceae bacterium]
MHASRLRTVFDPACPRWYSYVCAAAAVGAIAAIGAPLLGHLDLANIVMLFPLAVLFSAVILGRGPAVLAAVLSVVLFDVFFVPPHFTLVVSDVQYLLTFAVLLLVAVTTAQLAAKLRAQRDMAELREQEAHALYGMARELSAALTEPQIAKMGARFAREAFDARMSLWLPDADGSLVAVSPETDQPPGETASATLMTVYQTGRPCVAIDPTTGTERRHVPLKAPMSLRGVLELVPAHGAIGLSEEQERLLETFSSLLAIAVERVHYVAVAQRTEVAMESERLRNALLAALSHDLRTPLTAIVGLAETIELTPPPLGAEHTELVGAIRAEALRTTALVVNLLDLARFESGGIQLRREWQPLEEVVGAALQARASLLSGHRLVLDLPADLPLVEIDSVLMERVLCNLLENAAKYTPEGSRIEVNAATKGAWLELQVCDDGPGLPAGRHEELFEKFMRGRAESNVSGVGLGLAIVRSVMHAHGGTVRAFDRAGGGACFALALPLGEPPELPLESA